MLAKTSELMSPTLRDVPAEADVISHQLLVRSGLIRKAAAGVYTYLPLGYKVIRKIEEIVRQEMNRAGGQEIMMPIIQPAELWQKSGRWEVYGDEMFRLKDRHLRDFCLGPTHEEIITTLVQNEIRSYKELPLLLYQIQNKYRDEIRPRFGLLRCREFIMKDLYSFDRDEEGMHISYQKMYDAYIRIFQRVGIVFKAVEADSGAIGGNTSHEFMALADSGEASIAYCEQCDYVANVEKAEALVKDQDNGDSEAEGTRELVHTPGAKTIQALADFLKFDARKLLKTLFYMADKTIVAILLRGDRELNEIKLKNFLGCNDLHLASPEEIKEQLGTVIGYVGPVGLEGKVRILADNEVKTMKNFVIGANREDYHYINVNLERDFTVDDFWDLRDVEKGDPCPRCGAGLQIGRGIEVGQVFQLGTKYSKSLSATYTDIDGQEKHFLMGCYGIGVSRTMSAVIEQFHDDQGIIWPIAIAPYHVIVIPVSSKDQEQMQLAAKLAADLDADGIETMLDDRDERAGVKFTDADLIGCPLRITVGKKTVNEGTIDIKFRNSGEELTVKYETAKLKLKEIINKLSTGEDLVRV